MELESFQNTQPVSFKLASQKRPRRWGQVKVVVKGGLPVRRLFPLAFPPRTSWRLLSLSKKKQLFTQELLHKTISGAFSKDFASILSQINHPWLSEVSGCVSQQYYVKLHVDRKKKSTHLLLALLFRKCVPKHLVQTIHPLWCHRGHGSQVAYRSPALWDSSLSSSQ